MPAKGSKQPAAPKATVAATPDAADSNLSLGIQTGTMIGPYEIETTLGQGGMAVVYRAYHSRLSRRVAIKVLKGLAHQDPTTIKRFEREAKATALLRHPNILNVYDFGEFDSAPFMVSEYHSGGTLVDRLRKHPPDRHEALAILRGVANALDFAHRQGIVHRDVKPGNILLDENGKAVLGDFGLAKIIREASLVNTGVPTGTPAYVAPEQITESEVGPAADRYSFAVMAYELITGKLPFAARDFMKALYAHVEEQPAAPSTVAPDLPASLDAILLKGLAKDPLSRWDTCGEMVDALELVLADAPVSGRRRTVAAALVAAQATTDDLTRAFIPPAVSGSQSGSFQSHLQQPRRSRWAALLSAILAFALGVGFLVLIAGALRPHPTMAGPALQLSTRTAQPGQAVTVTAQHLPAGKAVLIYLDAQTVAQARTDSAGSVRIPATVPGAEPLGTHALKLCWDRRCPLATDLSVAAATATPARASAPAAKASPTPKPTRAAPSAPTIGTPVGSSSGSPKKTGGSPPSTPPGQAKGCHGHHCP